MGQNSTICHAETTAGRNEGGCCAPQHNNDHASTRAKGKSFVVFLLLTVMSASMAFANGGCNITTPPSNHSEQWGPNCNSDFQNWASGCGGAKATCGSNCYGHNVTWTNNCKGQTCSPCGSNTVVFTCTDECGNSSTCSAQFSCTTGSTGLKITTPASNQTVSCGSSVSSAFTTWLNNHGGAVATDNATVSWSNNCTVSAPNGCGSVTVKFTASDNCGNSATTSATFTVSGAGALTINKQASNDNVACGSSVSSSFSTWLSSHGGATATDNCSSVTWSNNCSVSAPSSCGSVAVKFTASDACGNTATTSATFTVTGSGALTITKQAAGSNVACGASNCSSTFSSWLSSHGGATATDNCSSVTWSNNCHVSAPTCCNSTTVVFTASDACGNTATTSATFSVGGNGGNLKLTNPAANQTVSCGSSVNSSFTSWLNNHGGATATDNGTVTWTNNCGVSAPSSCSSVTVKFTASDACGNTATTSATFTVSGAGALKITTPASNGNVACGASNCSSSFSSWLSNHGGAVATDNCSSVTWANNCHVSAPACCNSVSVVFTASDACGNTATTSAVFSVGGNGGNLKITTPASNDNVACGSSVSSQFTSWLNSHGGATATDNGTVTWSNNCNVSAPTSCGSVTVKFTASDACGNTATTSATFTVGGAGALTITTPASNSTVPCCTGVDSCTINFNNWCHNHGCTNITSCENNYTGWCNNHGYSNYGPYNSSNCCNSFNNWLQNNGGNCADPCNPSSTCENSFTSWCHSYGTDGHGTQPNCFSDYQKCFNSWCSSHTSTNAPCNSTAYNAWLNSNGGAVATDNCSSVTWTNNAPSTPPTCCNSVTVKFTATDACGNTATTSASFIVSGGGLTITPAKNDTVTCSANVNSAFNTWLASNGGSTTTSTGVTWSNNAGSNEIVPQNCGCVTVIFSATDKCGNVATTAANFCVKGSTPIVTKAASNDTVPCGEGAASAFGAWLANNGGATATSACGVTWSYGSPSLPTCCNSVTVVFTATDACGKSASTSAVFHVGGGGSLNITAALNDTINCNASGISDAFNAWLANNGGATATGSGIQWSNNAGSNEIVPLSCGCVTVTFTATDICGNVATTAANFCTEPATPVTLNVPANDTVPSCQTQDQVTAEYNAWFVNASVSGGCGANMNNNNPGAPSACGGVTTVVYTAADGCGNSTSNSATFVVNGPARVTFTCAANDTVAGTLSQDSINTLFAAWLNTATVSGGCSPLLTNTGGSPVACGSEDTVTFNVTDICGYSNSCTAYFVVTPASFTIVDCPAPRTLALVCGHAHLGPPTAACTKFRSVLTKTDFTCADLGVTNDTLIVTDASGAITICTWTVTVTDSVTIGQPGANASIVCPAVPSFTPPTFDACNFLNSYSTTTGTCPRVVTTYWYATDSCGVSSDTVSQAITVTDNVAPTVSGQGANASITCGQTPVFTAPTASDNCDLNPSIDSFSSTTTVGCTVTYIRSWYAVDACGNISDTVSQTITSVDNVAPTVSGQGANASITCGQSPVFTAPTANDNCDANPSIDSFSSTSTVSCTTTYTRSWYAIDACGNISDTVSQTITQTCSSIQLGTPGNDTTISCAACLNGVLPGFTAPSLTDNCCQATLFSAMDTIPGACPQSYSVTKMWWATDLCGNKSDTVSESVHVIDNTAPTIFGQGADTTVSCSGIPPFWSPSTHDDCDLNPTIHQNTVTLPGSCPQAYTMIRSWWSIDACGNISDTVSQTITVIDTTAPILFGQGANENISCPSCHVCVPGFTSPSAHDVCDLNPRISYVDDTIQGKCTGAYTITRKWTALDACGNVSQPVSQTITVGDTTAPVIGTPGANATITCTQVPVFMAPTATDNCDKNPSIDSFTVRTPGNCPQSYSVKRSWYAIDACGNISDTVSQTINVIDNVAPTIGGQGANATLACTQTPVFTAPTASDNCDPNPSIDSFTVRTPGNCPQSYSVKRSWYAIDACGNISDTVSQTINVIDNVAPTLSGVGMSKMIACSTTPVFQAPKATDNCDPNPTLDSTTVTTPGSCPSASIITRYWWATDACGNRSDSVHQTLHIIDNIAPTISGQGANASIQCTQTPVFSGPTASDNCDPNPSIDSFTVRTPGNCPQSYSVKRSWYAIDACGNISDTVSQTINVIDNVAPTIGGQGANATIQCTQTPVFSGPTASDNCDPNPSIDSFTVRTPGNCPQSYSVKRSWYAIDACGNISDTVSQTINVIDNVAPTIRHTGENHSVVCTSLPNFGYAIATDNCDPNPTIDSFDVRTPGNCPQAYSITRNWYAVDACGNISDTVKQTVSVVDNVAPTIGGQGPNATIQCTQTPVFNGPTASDNCDPNPSIDSFTVRTPGNCPQSYSVKRSWYAVDACGNISDTVSQTINVIDNVAPTIGGQGANATIQCTATPVFHAPTASDNCDPNPSIDSFTVRIPGSCPQSYSVKRSWYAIDACGNISDTVSQTINVIDNVAPVVSAQGSNVTVPCTELATVSFTAPTVTDNCDPNPTLHSYQDSTGTCPHSYSITRNWYAVDACGNISDTVHQTITVTDVAPTAICKTDTVTLNANNLATITAADVDGGSFDSCGSVMLSVSPDTFTCAGVGYATVTLTVTDECGSVSTCQAVVVVFPNTPVKAICPPDRNLMLECGVATLNPEVLAVDTCTKAKIGLSQGTFTCENIGVNVLTVSDTDIFGTVTSCTWRVTVVDSVGIGTPGNDTTIQCNAVNSDRLPFTAPAIESCDLLNSYQTRTPGRCSQDYSITRYWYASDSCGTVSDTVHQTLNVIDNTAPVLGTPGASATIECSQTPAFTAPTVSDNCDANPTLDSATVTTPGKCAYSYTEKRSWWAVDACGNMSDTVSQTINVVDNVAPTLSGQGDDTTLTCLDCIKGVPGFIAPKATDNCDPNPTISSVRDSIPGACPQSYSIVMKWWATDACGNISDTVTQSINVVDNTPPSIFGQGPDTTVSCSSVIPVMNPSTHDDCDLNPTIYTSQTTLPGSCPQSYTIINKWWAIDHCGNISDTVSQTINVIDTTAPVLFGQGANEYISCPTCHVCVPGFTAPSAHDVCDLNPRISFKDDTTAGKCTAAYSITRTWTAYDACGNVSKPVSQTITVSDTIRPTVIGQGANATIQCTQTPVFTAPTASDNCDANPMLDSATVTTPGNCPQSYSVKRSWWAVDACGNLSDTVSQTINVIDNTRPTISGQGANATIQCTQTPVFHAPTASAACNASVVIDSNTVRNPGNCPQSYSVVRGWWAVDACGNISDTVYQTINVIDNVAPTLTGVGMSKTIECTATPVFTAPTASDNCDPSPKLDSFTVNTPGVCPQSYTLTRYWYAVDACGNISDTVHQVIHIINNNRPVISGQGANATIQCTQTPVFTAPTATASCNATTTLDSTTVRNPGNCPQSYSVKRSWWAVDACGNISDTVSQTINVVDNVAPTISHTGENHSVECSATPVFGHAIASDNCDPNPTIDSFDVRKPGSCPQSYSITRNWYAVDACGNISDTVSQIINVIDNIAPTLSGVGNDTTINCIDCINGVPGFTKPTVSDNCDPNPTLYVLVDTTAGACPQSFSVTKKWYAIDACGNISDTVMQTVHVIDNTPPTITGQGANKTVSCDGNLSFTNPSVHDGCDLNPTVYAWDTTVQGSCPQSYTLIKKWWAIDHCGNISDTVSQTISVVDNTAPVLSGQGSNEFINCPSCQICVPGFTSPNVSDNCDLNPRVSYADVTTPGVCSNAYTITRTWTAVDACGNTSLPVSQTITVADTTAPVLTCAGDQTLACGSTVTFGTPAVSDNCDLTPNVAIVSSDTTNNNDGSVTYTRNWSASDACGNSSTCSQVITTLACNQSTTRKDDEVATAGTTNGDDMAKLIAYPNPAHDYVTFSMTFSNDEQNVSLEMYNVTGQKIATIFQGNVNANQEYKVPFQTSSLASGTYYYRLSTSARSIVDKLTIVR